jgi:hypothetical protein
MDALSEAIARVLGRLDRMESRIARLETAQGISAPRPVRAEEPPPRAAVPVWPAAPVVEPPPTEPPPPAAGLEPARALETRLGLTWLNRIGVLTVVLAVAFFFKYAVDNQWIGETGRVVLGVLAGFATLALAEAIWRKGHRIYAQGIVAAGITILYLSFYASFGFYGLVKQGPAFLLLALTTAMAGALAIRYGAIAVSMLGLTGGYLTPLLLRTHEDRPWAFFGYLLLLNIGALAVARAQRWLRLAYLAFAGTVLLYFSWFIDRFRAEKQTVATVFALAYYALFSSIESPVVFAVSQVLANLALLAIWRPPEAVYLWLSLALAGAGLYISDRRGWPIAPVATFGAFWTCSALWQMDLRRPQELGAIVLAFTLGFLLFLGWTAWRILVRRVEARKEDLVVTALNGAAYFGICYHLLRPDYNAYLGLFAAALAGIHLALGMHIRHAQAPEAERDTRPVLLFIGIALGFLTLAAPIQFSGYRITMSWALEAAALSWIGVRTRARRLVYAALLVFLLTFLRLCAIDAWIYPNAAAYHAMANVRFLTFLAAAACLWLSARWIGTGAAAFVPYVAGHFVVLWALILETLGWAERTASAGNAGNVGTVSVSVLMAAYGMLLVALGVLSRLGFNRILGLGLLSVVVLKLYLYDVWQLGRIYRVVAFGFLGVLLLATSFLYSRFRTTVENWWKM